MTIDLPPQLAAIVSRMVSVGRFDDETQVVAAALTLLEDHEAEEDVALAARDEDQLREWAKVGFDQLAAGRSAPLDIERVKASARRRFLG